MSSITGQIGRLLESMPKPGAPASQRAAWFLAKAEVLRAIAAEGGPNSAEALALAAKAERDAGDILTTEGAGGGS